LAGVSALTFSALDVIAITVGIVIINIGAIDRGAIDRGAIDGVPIDSVNPLADPKCPYREPAPRPDCYLCKGRPNTN
jgi:hypothetical protein